MLKLRLQCSYQRSKLRLKTWVVCGHKYHTKIDPYRVIWINPNQIVQRSKVMIPNAGHFSYCQVLDGNWDLTELRFEEMDIFKMLHDHFQNDVNWVDIHFFKDIPNYILEEGSYWNGCRSEMDILNRCSYLDQLFDTIKKIGYINPEGLNYGEIGLTSACLPVEIAVNIGRDGRFLFWDGRHRLAIAKILDLPLIPVRVVVRHKLWQELRDEIKLSSRRNTLPDHLQSYTTHPDISYLLG